MRRCCERFRDNFYELNDLDSFCSIAIAAACVCVLRTQYLKQDTFVQLPMGGYRRGAR